MHMLLEMLCLFLILVHYRLFGERLVEFTKTDKVITLTYEVAGIHYCFKSTQYVYKVINSGIFKYTSISYIYRVDRIGVGHESLTCPCAYYTNLCPGFLKNTSYPHRLAINAHFRRLQAK